MVCNLQDFEIKNPKLREELKPLSWNQSQITDASHLFVFCNYKMVNEKDVDDLIILKSKTELIKFRVTEIFVKGKLKRNQKQKCFIGLPRTYIALQML